MLVSQINLVCLFLEDRRRVIETLLDGTAQTYYCMFLNVLTVCGVCDL
jgi:hypothetical protein